MRYNPIAQPAAVGMISLGRCPLLRVSFEGLVVGRHNAAGAEPRRREDTAAALSARLPSPGPMDPSLRSCLLFVCSCRRRFPRGGECSVHGPVTALLILVV